MSPDDLLLQVLLAPGDEALRAVYVDQLLERGDLRGEHARLVRQGRAADAELLARKHAHAWLPPALAPFVVDGSARFRDGLLDGCTLRPMNGADAKELAADPIWAAVRALDRPPFDVIAQATALEELTGVDDALLATLGGWKTRLSRLTHLGLRVGPQPHAQHVLLNELDLPALSSLSVLLVDEGFNGRHCLPDPGLAQCCEDCARPIPPREATSFRPGEWSELFSSPLGGRLRSLTFHVGWVDLAQYVEALEATRCDVAVLHLRAAEEPNAMPGWSLALYRTAPGRYRALELEADATSPDEEEDLRAVLNTRPEWLELRGALSRRAKRLAPDARGF